jgi:hypothetical protein
MKYLKMLGIVAVVAGALTALVGAGAASATVLYSNGSKLGTGTAFEATGTNLVFKMGFATIECSHSEMAGKTETAGSASQTVEGKLSSLSFTGCNGTFHVLKSGKLIFHYTSGSNGTVTSEGTELTIAFSGTSCTYGTPTATNFGALTGGSPATLNASSPLTRLAGGFLCANPASWTAAYTFTSPNPLEVKES